MGEEKVNLEFVIYAVHKRTRARVCPRRISLVGGRVVLTRASSGLSNWIRRWRVHGVFCAHSSQTQLQYTTPTSRPPCLSTRLTSNFFVSFDRPGVATTGHSSCIVTDKVELMDLDVKHRLLQACEVWSPTCHCEVHESE